MVILSASVLRTMSRNLGSKVSTTYNVHMFHISVCVVKFVCMTRKVTDRVRFEVEITACIQLTSKKILMINNTRDDEVD